MSLRWQGATHAQSRTVAQHLLHYIKCMSLRWQGATHAQSWTVAQHLLHYIKLYVSQVTRCHARTESDSGAAFVTLYKVVCLRWQGATHTHSQTVAQHLLHYIKLYVSQVTRCHAHTESDSGAAFVTLYKVAVIMLIIFFIKIKYVIINLFYICLVLFQISGDVCKFYTRNCWHPGHTYTLRGLLQEGTRQEVGRIIQTLAHDDLSHQTETQYFPPPTTFTSTVSPDPSALPYFHSLF